MLYIRDLLTDDSDDIIIKGDILTDNSSYDSTIKNVERRIVARYDDFLSDIAAGIERFIFGTKTIITIISVKTCITNALLSDGLLEKSDFDILISETKDRILHILIKFNNPYIGNNNLFKVIIDIQNQRVFRG